MPDQPEELAEARRRVAEGTPEDLVRLPNPSFPSFISAATLVDQAETPPQLRDFFGAERQDGGVTRIACPLLVFFGTRGDVGDADRSDLVRSTPVRLSLSGLRVETALIDGADHIVHRGGTPGRKRH